MIGNFGGQNDCKRLLRQGKREYHVIENKTHCISVVGEEIWTINKVKKGKVVHLGCLVVVKFRIVY